MVSSQSNRKGSCKVFLHNEIIRPNKYHGGYGKMQNPCVSKIICLPKAVIQHQVFGGGGVSSKQLFIIEEAGNLW